MIRTEHEEFFIEPLEKGQHMIQQEEEGAGREHIVYRTSAVKKKPHVGPGAADYRTRGQSPTRPVFSFLLKLYILHKTAKQLVQDSFDRDSFWGWDHAENDLNYVVSK